MPAVSNTSPILNLAIIGYLFLMREQFGQLFIPPAVLHELRIEEDLPGSRAVCEAIDNKTPSLFRQALETVEQLPESDQEALLEIIKARLIERRRTEIARHARETIQAFREGRARYGTLEDMKDDLLSER